MHDESALEPKGLFHDFKEDPFFKEIAERLEMDAARNLFEPARLEAMNAD